MSRKRNETRQMTVRHLIFSRAQKSRRLVTFGVVGIMGFLADALILYAVMEFAGAGPFSGRVFSILAAMLTTWYLNRTITFSAGKEKVFAEVTRYAAVKAIGLIANLTIYSVIINATSQDSYPLLALVVASGASLLINFALVKRFVFIDQKRSIAS